MAIRQSRQPPADGIREVARALRDLRSHPEASEMLAGAAVDLSEPLPLYRLTLEEIDPPTTFLRNARPCGWRYLIEPVGAHGAAYADVREAGGSTTFSSLSENRNASRLNEAAHLAEREAAALPDCEVRVLDIPALSISAIWLAGPVDTFIPFIDPDRLADTGTPVAVDPDFTKRIEQRAAIARDHFKSAGETGAAN